jgi:hypothetical protein
MGGGKRATSKSQGHVHTAHVKRQRAVEEWQVQLDIRDAREKAKKASDDAANRARTGLMVSASYYAGLFIHLYTAVNAASADYTDLLNMKDRPEITEVLLETTLAALKLFAPGAEAIKTAFDAAEMIETAVKPAAGLVKVFEAGQSGDPNHGAKMRIAAARGFFSELDKASDSIQATFAEAFSLVDSWQASPQGDLMNLVRQKLRKLRLKFDVPAGVKDPTNLFTDFFLYDMIGAYVKACVSLNYTHNSVSFPGGDSTHLRPEDHYFDEAEGKFVWVDGLKEEACKTIYEMLGRESPHAHELYRAHRSPVSRPGDLVTIWGAAFYRQYSREVLEPDGSWANQSEADRAAYLKAAH